MEHNTTPVPSFDTLGISQELLGILTRNKFTTPTPIQHQVIPAGIEGKDIVGIAQTGTGKTLAFGIPMLERLLNTKGQGLVLLPTRELALQVNDVLEKIGRPLGIRTAVLIGGASMHTQIQHLRRAPHIVIATPGRLADHLEQRTFNLNQVNVVVLDEADRMFDIGFAPQIKKILALAPKNRQTLLFSATMPHTIAQMAVQFMNLPLRIEVAPQGTSSANVEQEIFIVHKDVKIQLLQKILADNAGTMLIFSRTKFGAKRIAAAIRAMGHTAVEIHSNRSLAQRKAALAGFKSGQYRILVATDIAARGIDVTGISIVINFDLPDNSEDYVHRIGRTGRAGHTGKAISFAAPNERGAIRQIERLIKKTLPVRGLPALPERIISAEQPSYEPRREQSRGGRPFRGGSSGGRGYGGGGGGSRRPSRFQRSDRRGGDRREGPADNSSQKPSYHQTFRKPTSQA